MAELVGNVAIVFFVIICTFKKAKYYDDLH